MNNKVLSKEAILEIMKDLFRKIIPFNEFLGIKLTRMTPEYTEAKITMREELVGNSMQGILHGGIISTMLDTVGGVVAMARSVDELEELDYDSLQDRIKRFRTIDMRIDYLLPGKGEEFTAGGRIIRYGRKVAVSKMELRNEKNDLIAVGTATYIVV